MGQAQELFAEVRRLGALGQHAEAQAVQERANIFWMQGLGRISQSRASKGDLS
jgi:hypothetical protein